MRRDMNTRLIFTAAGLSAGALLTLGLSVGAEDTELDSDPRVIPYNGVLEFDGQAYNGPADIRFTLTGEDPESCTFVEEHEDVPVYTGRFSVNIGVVNGDAGMNCLFDATAVYLQMAVRGGASEQEHAPLAGRQRINPVPFAYWAAEGSDLKVDGHLSAASASVNGPFTAESASVNGPLTANSASVSGGVTASSATVSSHLTANTATVGNVNMEGPRLNFTSSGRGDGGRALVHAAGDILYVNPGGEFSGGTRLDGGLTASGGVTVGGILYAPTIQSVTSINSGGGAFSTGGNVTVGGDLVASGRFIQLPLYSSPPFACSGQSGIRGAMYYDTSQSRNGFGWETPCVCLIYNGTFRWRQFSDPDATCD